MALLTLACLLATGRSSQLLASSLRETPAVRAVRNITPSVVNIRSEKTVTADSVLYATRGGQKVAGMGTGVVVDSRGYIVTNYHVIAGVDWLRVTLSDGGVHTARIVSFDRQADLGQTHAQYRGHSRGRPRRRGGRRGGGGGRQHHPRHRD